MIKALNSYPFIELYNSGDREDLVSACYVFSSTMTTPAIKLITKDRHDQSGILDIYEFSSEEWDNLNNLAHDKRIECAKDYLLKGIIPLFCELFRETNLKRLQ